MAELPLAPIKRIMKKAGAERVADDAVEAMADVLQQEAVALSKQANKFAAHADRKTVKKEDVVAAR